MGSALVKDLKKFYEDANDQHVGAITLYGDASASKAYADAAKSLGMTVIVESPRRANSTALCRN